MSRTFEFPSRVLVASGAVLIASFVVSGCATTSQDGAARSSTAETASTIETAAPSADESLPNSSDYFAGSGTDDIDVESYALDASVTIDGADHLDASATIAATAVAGHDLATFELDLVGLEVAAVEVDGSAAAFSRTETKLVVTPERPVADGAEFITIVRYSGDPSQRDDPTDALEDGGGWLDVGDYSAVLSEPIGARTWLPSNDRPSDKALVSMSVEVPAGVVAVSNGRLLDRSDDGRTASFRWVADEPMAPYLITLAIGDFELTTESIPVGPEVINAVPSSVTALGAARFEAVPSMLAFFGERFGPYPFSTVGGVIVPGLPPTALECQTRPVYSQDAISENDQGQLVAHELAHQWFGDAVTPESWNDIWLNEGPAVYSQWLWLEEVGGPSVLDSARTSYDPDDEALAVPPAAPGEAEMFGTSVYERSAMFLVELRERLGTETFDELMRTWVADHRFGNASTEDFVELAGSIAGASIEDLSGPWLYGDQLPELSF